MLPEFKMEIRETCIDGEKCKAFRLHVGGNVFGMGALKSLNAQDDEPLATFMEVSLTTALKLLVEKSK
jgi:hypothetical protein